MSIPLVQNNEKDSINTSIIAIKRQIERINMLLGLVDSGSPDLSGLATKQELEDAVNSLQPVDSVTSGNMQSVTSNAVAEAIGKVISQNLDFVINVGNNDNYSEYYTVPKGTYITIGHFDHASYYLDLNYALQGSALLSPSRNGVVHNGINGGFATVMVVLQSDGTKQIRGVVYPYGAVSASHCIFNLTLIKVAE